MSAALRFLIFIIVIILKFIFNRDEITRDLIAGAAVVYLLTAITWTYVYRLIEMIQPGSFAIAQSQIFGEQSPFLYYSFVTITTLGYGDVTPVSNPARSLALLEAILGQLYIAILIARLVGTHIAQASRNGTNL